MGVESVVSFVPTGWRWRTRAAADSGDRHRQVGRVSVVPSAVQVARHFNLPSTSVLSTSTSRVSDAPTAANSRDAVSKAR